MTTPLPILKDETLKTFASANNMQTVVPVRTGRFIVPIPDLNDGGGDLKLPNVKELESIIKSGDLGTTIKSAVLEGCPQIVPIDGTQIVVINNISPRQARAMQAIYNDIAASNNGQMNRKSLVEFFEAATGIAYDPASNTISAVSDNIGIHGDVYNMPRQTFKNRHNHYGTEDDLTGVADGDIQTGHYQKKRSPTQGFAISGGFIRQAESGTQQTFPETAMIQVGSDGVISAIHGNDINVSYETPDGKKLVDGDGKINLPTYPVGQILLAQRDAPSVEGVGRGKTGS